MKNGAEKPQMAHVNGICAGLVGPKSENIKKALVLLLLFDGSRVPRGSSEKKQPGEPYRLGGGRGRVNPPPRRMVWRFWEVLRFFGRLWEFGGVWRSFGRLWEDLGGFGKSWEWVGR